jgi:hypothetical protein
VFREQAFFLQQDGKTQREHAGGRYRIDHRSKRTASWDRINQARSRTGCRIALSVTPSSGCGA